MLKKEKEDFLTYATKFSILLEKIKLSCSNSNIAFDAFQKIIDKYHNRLYASTYKISSRSKDSCNQDEPFVEKYSPDEFIRKNEIHGIIATKILLKIQSEHSNLDELQKIIECYIDDISEILKKKNYAVIYSQEYFVNKVKSS